MPLGPFDRTLRMRLPTFSFSESQLFSFFPHPPPEPGRPPFLLSFLLTFSLSAFQNFSFYSQNGGGRGVGRRNRVNHEPKRKRLSFDLAPAGRISGFPRADSSGCDFFGGFFSSTVGARERRRLWTAGILYSQLLGMSSFIAAGVCYLPRIEICIQSSF